MEAPRRTHPLVIVAAGAVSLFSLVGIGAVLGWIPTSVGGNTPVAQIPEQTQAQTEPAKAAEPKAQPKPVARSEARRSETLAVASPPPPAPVAVAAICRECAVIEEVREVEKPGQASGVGAVGGAVVGGILGHQVGSGRGKDLATVLGAIGGGVGGNQIEKNVKKEKEYQIVVRYDDGSKGLFTQATPPAWRKGDRVKVVDGAIQSSG